MDFHLASSGVDRAGEHTENIPDPVSFDPGSSPD
jgi:hypothetical protein